MMTVVVALLAWFASGLPGRLLADVSYQPPVRCVADARNPILGCWERVYRRDGAIWSFHADGYMRNGLLSDLALGKPQLTGAFELIHTQGGAVLLVDDAAGSRSAVAVGVTFHGRDQMVWYDQYGQPQEHWQRVAFIPRFPDNRDQLAHIFRRAEGHYAVDAESGRRSIVDTIQQRYFAGIDVNGNEVYLRTNQDGSQNWAYVRNGVIRNGGINISNRFGFDRDTRRVIELW